MQFATDEGTTAIRSQPRAFVAAFARRIATGLFPGAPPKRTLYTVTREGGDSLQFRAANWCPAINVGLNDVELAAGGGRVRYTVRYPRWAVYVVALSDVIGFALIAFLLLFDVRAYLARHPAATLPACPWTRTSPSPG
jgi:hypothetical protein